MTVSFPPLPPPHSRVGVGGVLLDRDRALVNRAVYRERFTLPSGFVDPGESLEQALRREFLEETGVEVRVGALLLARHKVVRTDESDVYFAFRVEAERGTPEARPPEIAEIRFVDVEEAPRASWISELSRIAIARAVVAQSWPRSPWTGGEAPGLRTELFHSPTKPDR